MKEFFYSFVLLFVLGSVSLFSQVNSNYDGPKPEVVAGAKSFVFQYTPFQSDLEPVYVGTVSFPGEEILGEDIHSLDLFGAGFRYFVSNHIAIGLGVNLGIYSSTIESEEERSAATYGTTIYGNYHFKSLYSVSPYVGIRTNFGIYSGSRTITSTGGQTTEMDYYGWGFGFHTQFGFDWYFTEGLSLGGNYSIGTQILGEPEVTTGDVTEKGQSSISWGISSASIILNVHF